MYVKLFGSILDSSVWDESAETRLVWITMLLMADENGFVRGTPQSVARRAVVTPEQATNAIKTLEAPDPRSHTTDHEGRRLQPMDGGWLVLNYTKYREYRTRKQVKEAEKKRRQRARGDDGGTCPARPAVSPPYASASPSASVSVVSSSREIFEKLLPEARPVFLAENIPDKMDAVMTDEAAKRGWSAVSLCVIEMSCAGAKWTPYVFRKFLEKIPAAPPKLVTGAVASRWCQHCDGPEMRENASGRLMPYHVEGCPHA